MENKNNVIDAKIGNLNELTKVFDWFAFNDSIISKHLIGKRKTIAIDPSYIPKSDKKTSEPKGVSINSFCIGNNIPYFPKEKYYSILGSHYDNTYICAVLTKVCKYSNGKRTRVHRLYRA